jgi:acetyltransferase-like isoleucine patch superfamily enzyme
MSRVKPILAAALAPLAWLADRPARACGRLWAHARLRRGLGGRLHGSVVVDRCPELHGTRRITLGAGLYLYPGQYWETQGQGRIDIGDGVVLSRGVHLAARAAIHIGAGTMIGEYASIRDADHVSGVGPLRAAPHRSQPIRIGREVWIGRGAVILKGVSIGDGAVVAANAVVTRDVPAGATVAGVPARPLVRRAPGRQEPQ